MDIELLFARLNKVIVYIRNISDFEIYTNPFVLGRMVEVYDKKILKDISTALLEYPDLESKFAPKAVFNLKVHFTVSGSSHRSISYHKNKRTIVIMCPKAT